MRGAKPYQTPLAQTAVLQKPVTVKIRKGWDEENIVAVEAAKRIEKAGASLITIHGRTREEYYGGIADFTLTGTLLFFTTLLTISSTKSKLSKSLLPSPFLTTFGAGQL